MYVLLGACATGCFVLSPKAGADIAFRFTRADDWDWKYLNLGRLPKPDAGNLLNSKPGTLKPKTLRGTLVTLIQRLQYPLIKGYSLNHIRDPTII